MNNKKAINITKENQQQLMTRYGFPQDDTDAFPIGFVLVTWFGDNGDSRYEGVLTQENFNATYVKGEALQNGFYAITYR